MEQKKLYETLTFNYQTETATFLAIKNEKKLWHAVI